MCVSFSAYYKFVIFENLFSGLVYKKAYSSVGSERTPDKRKVNSSSLFKLSIFFVIRMDWFNIPLLHIPIKIIKLSTGYLHYSLGLAIFFINYNINVQKLKSLFLFFKIFTIMKEENVFISQFVNARLRQVNSKDIRSFALSAIFSTSFWLQFDIFTELI